MNWTPASKPPDTGRLVMVKVNPKPKLRRVVVGYWNHLYWEVLYGIEFLDPVNFGFSVTEWSDFTHDKE